MGQRYLYFPRTLSLKGQIRRKERAGTFLCGRAGSLLLVDLAGSIALPALELLQIIEDLHKL